MTNKENKYRDWVFTWNEPTLGEFITSSELKFLLEKMPLVEKFVFQLEAGENTHREHFQGAFRTTHRVRQSTLLNSFMDNLSAKLDSRPDYIENLKPFLTINRMCGTWEESFSYCTKSDTAIEEPVMSDALIVYDGADVSFLKEKENRYPWQNSFAEKILSEDENSIKTPDDRKIVWVWDTIGNSGKSKFIKYLCVTYNDIAKVSFGTGSQLRSGIISMGKRDVYIIDMPRTRAEEDSIASLVATLEDLKNGYIVSCMYGAYSKLLMTPPHIIVFSNEHCPMGMLSADRWESYRIDSVTKKLEPCN